MSGEEVFSSANQLPHAAAAREATVTITFEGEFIVMIDKLVEKLAATAGVPGEVDEHRRRLAIATAVSTLSEFAGEPLYVGRRGQHLRIEGLWR